MRFILTFFLSVAAALLPLSATAEDNLQAGVDYIELQPPQPVRVPAGKIEVREFFNYSCPHCFRLQGHLSKWIAEHSADDVVFIHQPLVFARYNGHFASVYYTLQGLKKDKELHDKVYDAIHVQRNLINSKGRFLDWLEEQGIDRAKAEKMYDSFTVKSRTARADTIAGDYGINSTPQMSVSGKYIISPGISRSYEAMMDTLTTLVERERQALAQ